MVSQVGERAVACLWPEIVADRSFVLVEQHAASGTFEQLEDSRARTRRGCRTRCARSGSATERPAGDVPWPGAAPNARCIPTSQPQLVKQRCGSRTAYDPVCWHGNARPTGWARSRARQDTIGLYSVIPEGAAGCRSEPATANAARKSATTSQRALRRPAASASKPMAGGPARLAK